MRALVVALSAGVAIGVAALAPRFFPDASHAGDDAAARGNVLVVPGTGLSVIPPHGTHLAPLGSFLTDADGKVMITIVVGHAERNPYADKLFAALFPGKPVAIHCRGIDGLLYRRTRAQNGGAWDGWQLRATSGDRSLAVQIAYSGDSPEEFEKLRDFMTRLEWDPAQVDAEAAFGARVYLPDMALDRKLAAGLHYTKDGKGDDAEAFDITAMPIPPASTNRFGAAECAKLVGIHFKDKPYAGAHPVAAAGAVACEGSTADGAGGLDYALVAVYPGAVVNATGHGNSAAEQPAAHAERWRNAVLGMRRMR